MSGFNLPVENLSPIFQRWARLLRSADQQNLKRNQDLELGLGRLVLTSPDGTRFLIAVDNDGALEARPMVDGIGHATGSHTAFDSAFDGGFA